MRLNDNFLSGPIPADLGKLSSLVGLRLSRNFLSGSIPAELGGLTGLDELSLSFNSLSGPIPHELGNLTDLRFLYVDSFGLCLARGFPASSFARLAQRNGLSVCSGESSVTVSFAEPTYMAIEGGAGAQVMVGLSAGLDREVTIALNTKGTDGIARDDYTLEAVPPARVTASSDPDRVGQLDLTFAANTTAATLILTAVADADPDPGELYIAVLDGPEDMAKETPAFTRVQLLEAVPQTVTVSFAQSTYAATEGGAAAAVTVQLSAPLATAVTIPLGTDPFGAGVTEADYTVAAVSPASLTAPDAARPWLLDLTFAAGTTVATLLVTAVDDTEEDPGGVLLVIRGDTLPAGVTEGALDSTVVNFREGDPVTVSFAQSTYTATEGGAAAEVMVQLSAPLASAVTIPLGTDAFGTNVTEADYTVAVVLPASVTVPDPARPWLLDLTFAAGTTVATLLVTAVDDTEEDPGGVLLVIRGDTLPAGVTEGALDSTVVNFREGDPVTVSFAQSTYTATEGGAAAEVMVQLSAPLDRAVTIPLGTDAFGTNVTEADYTVAVVLPASVTVPDPARPWLLDLTFAAGTTVATLLVTAVDDTEEDPGGVLLVIHGDTLPAGVTEGALDSTVVNLREGDPGGCALDDLGTLSGTVTVTGALDNDCVSPNRSGELARFYSFTLERPAAVEIDLVSSEFDAWLALREGADVAGRELVQDDDGGQGTNSRIATELSAGTHTIEATSYGPGETGAFTLTVTVAGGGGGGCAPDDLGALSGAVMRVGNLGGDCESPNYPGKLARYYSFTLGQAGSVEIDLFSSVFDTWLTLREGTDVAGRLVVSDDDGGQGTNSRIATELSAGTYTIEATSYATGVTGAFTLAVTGAGGGGGGCALDDLGALSGTATRVGNLGVDCESPNYSGKLARYYSFTLGQAGPVEIDLVSSVFDTFLALREGTDVAGRLVVADDDGGQGTNSRIGTELSAGTYTVEATSYATGVTGAFTLTVTGAGGGGGGGGCAPDDLGALSGTATRVGNLGVDCESRNDSGKLARYYSFTLWQAGPVEIDLVSSAFDTWLALREGAGVAGRLVVSDDDGGQGTNSRIGTELSAGTYTVEATSYAPGVTGAFTLTVTGAGGGGGGGCAPDDLGALSGTATRVGNLGVDCESRNDSGKLARYYSFTLWQAGSVQIDLVSSAFDTWLTLREGAGVAGRLVVSDDDGGQGTNSRIGTELSAGTYTVEATSYAPGVTGAFTLTVTRPTGATTEVSAAVESAASFTDHPIVRGVTPIKAVHFTELRTRIDALRDGSGLARFQWTDPVLVRGVTPIRAVHLGELRAALGEAYVAAGRAAPGWTDAAPTPGVTPIKAVYLMELRAAVVAFE